MKYETYKNIVFDSTYTVVGNALDINARRHNLITSNIANLDTIGYKPTDLNFQETLTKALSSPPPNEVKCTNKKHFEVSNEKYWDVENRYDESDEIHLDSVDIDQEMLKLAENNLKYKSTIEMLLRKMTMLKTSIVEGGK